MDESDVFGKPFSIGMDGNNLARSGLLVARNHRAPRDALSLTAAKLRIRTAAGIRNEILGK